MRLAVEAGEIVKGSDAASKDWLALQVLLVGLPFMVFVFAVALYGGILLFDCDPYYREIAITADGEWSGVPESWIGGRLPNPDRLRPEFEANQARARALGVCR